MYRCVNKMEGSKSRVNYNYISILYNRKKISNELIIL